MIHYLGFTKFCDIPHVVGNATFEKDRFVWKARHKDSQIIIYYKDVTDIQTSPGQHNRWGVSADTIYVYCGNRQYSFYARQVQDFVKCFYEGIIETVYKPMMCGIKEGQPFVRTKPMSDEDITKLERLAKLRDENVISKEEFDTQKDIIVRGE